MMKTITAKNVNIALREALWHLKLSGVRVPSRNGDVIMAPGPVTTCYSYPKERVLFSDMRDANPYFHLMESIWMLAGRNDVAFPTRFAKQMYNYSDDGVTLHGAYGYRWRNYFGYDQLTWLIDTLRADRMTRRAVLTMWDGGCAECYLDAGDLHAAGNGGLDVPCNTHVYFSAALGQLDMTVCCRSNDAIWGAYGANAVHFSMLHQFMAEATGIPLGLYYQVSNNLHVYADRPDVQRLLSPEGDVLYVPDDRYGFKNIVPESLLQTQEPYEWFLEDAARLTNDTERHYYNVYRTEFFIQTVLPMFFSHTAYKGGNMPKALSFAETIHAADWRAACIEWLGRRRKS
jgi:hypothetical protein